MRDKALVAVIIPIYKVYPDVNELISLRQCINVLKDHPIIFAVPHSLDASFYHDFCKNDVEFNIEIFNDECFTSIDTYNQLMLSKAFYKRFTNFKYILIYQLDAYVFKDELVYWCNQGYDYIGAPYAFIDMDVYPIKVLTKYRHFLGRMRKLIPGFYQFKQVGNGGLSLRNIEKTLFLLNFKYLQSKLWNVLMEDNFFQYWGNLMAPFFKLPDVKTAANFSIEMDAEKTFKLIGDRLPFGCHAYARYEPDFWKQFIEIH